jgi:hypothetical protein
LLALTNDTFSGNTATDGIGGAICIFSGLTAGSTTGTLTNCTLAGNQALAAAGEDASTYSNYYGSAIFGGDLTLNNTLIADDTSNNPLAGRPCANTETGTHDLQWPTGGATNGACVTGITFADPVIGPLANNGGPTLTMAPAAAAAVVQIGTGCPALDQTGATRGSPCTVGALER